MKVEKKKERKSKKHVKLFKKKKYSQSKLSKSDNERFWLNIGDYYYHYLYGFPK